MNASLSWDIKAVESLKKFVEEGLTASQIGAMLNRTRCSVIGKASRLGLSIGGGSRENRNRVVKPRYLPRPRKRLVAVNNEERSAALEEKRFSPETAFNVEAFEAAQKSQPVMLMDLREGDCRWPVGNGYCGGQAERRKSYCVHHKIIGIYKAASNAKQGDRRKAANWKNW